MCKLFVDWETEIKSYCNENGLDFEKAKQMPKSWNKDFIALQAESDNDNDAGLLDETPAPVVLWIRMGSNGGLVFEQTENTEKYLKKVS